jgi:DNA mismatch repair ATPase MutS
MAELRRLKSVVDKAKQHQSDNRPPILFLLDEILQGTNSRERQIAVAHVVGQLVQFGTTGLLSTHDLDLAKVNEVSDVAQIVHFREYFDLDSNGKQQMRFDYIMRPGPTPTTNALKLLEMVGLRESQR